MFRAVQSNQTTAVRRRRRISLRGVVAAACLWCAAVGNAQLNVTITDGQDAASADRRRAVRLAGLGARGVRPGRRHRRGFGQQRALRAARNERHGVAADAGVAGQLPAVAHARRGLPRHRHAHRGYGGQFHGRVPALRRAARRVAHGFQAADGPRRSAQSGASHLRHDLPGADGHSGRVQHADCVHQ